jgi:subtilisin family serine protease
MKGSSRLAAVAVCLLACVALVGFAGSSAAQRSPAAPTLRSVHDRAFAPGEVLVRFKPGLSAAARAEVLRDEAASVKESLALPGLRLVRVAPGQSVVDAVDAFERRPEVLFAEPNYVHRLTPDPYTNNTDSSLTMTTPLDLSGRIGCRAEYDLRLATEPGFDFFLLERASSPTGPWEFVDFQTGSTFGAFEPHAADLAADGQASVFLRLGLLSDELVTDDGAYVDDLAVACLGSTFGPQSYQLLSGTSMAAPHVTGVAALKWAQTPAATVDDVKNAILNGVDLKPGLMGVVGTGGRLNACKTLVPGCPSPAPNPPNDPRFGELWGLHQASDADIDAPEAWGTEVGDPSVTVAVVDSGVAYDHPDLDSNIWTNTADPPGGGDEDGNGLVDDVRGWDFVDDDNDPRDGFGHGTHVAGTIGAEGNNLAGIAGVNWDVGLMPLRAGNSFGLLTSDIVASFVYACAKDAKVVNGSFGGYEPSASILAALQTPACADVLFVFSAGNESNNNDDFPAYPCAFGAPPPEANLPNVICVAASDETDQLADFSNFGFASVDLAAPGVDVLSAALPDRVGVSLDTFEADLPGRWTAAQLPGNRAWGRTSEASSSGAFSVTDSPTLPPVVVPPDQTPPNNPTPTSPSHRIGVPTDNTWIDVRWSGASDAGSGVDGFSYLVDTSPTTLPDTNKDAEEGAAGDLFPDRVNGTYYFHLRTRDNAGNWSGAVHLGPLIVSVRGVVPVRRCVVPNVKGKTVAATRKALRARRCALGKVRRAYSKVRQGRVIRQSRRPGARLRPGTKVNVLVSRGRRR